MSDFWLFIRVLFLVSCYTGLIFAPLVWAVVHQFTKHSEKDLIIGSVLITSKGEIK